MIRRSKVPWTRSVGLLIYLPLSVTEIEIHLLLSVSKGKIQRGLRPETTSGRQMIPKKNVVAGFSLRLLKIPLPGCYALDHSHNRSLLMKDDKRLMDLCRNYAKGRIDRREFMARAAAMGLGGLSI